MTSKFVNNFLFLDKSKCSYSDSSKSRLFRIITGSGFTLIELLVVMAILGVLAIVVLVMINPTEQLSKAHDTGRMSAVNQMGHQVQSYYTSQNGIYPDPSQWDQELVTTNELSSFPPGVEYFTANGITNCLTNERPSTSPTFCYDLDSSGNNYGALIFAKLESINARSKCTTSGDYPYFVYSTADGRGGVVCAASDPAPWAPGTVNYLN